MVKYIKADIIDSHQKNRVMVILILSSDKLFDRFCLTNGIVIRSKKEVDAQTYLLAPKNTRAVVMTGKETLP